MEEAIPYSELMNQVLRPENCMFVCIQDLEFSSLNVDILLHMMTYEQLLERLKEAKNG